MIVGADEILQITDYVWTTVLGFDLETTSEPPGEGVLHGWVSIYGAWQGLVLLECQPCLARDAARVMFQRDDDGISDDELRDAVGELTNMIGGNIKSLLPNPSDLSLPQVADRPPALEGTTVSCGFRSRRGGFRITLVKAD